VTVIALAGSGAGWQRALLRSPGCVFNIRILRSLQQPDQLVETALDLSDPSLKLFNLPLLVHHPPLNYRRGQRTHTVSTQTRQEPIGAGISS